MAIILDSEMRDKKIKFIYVLIVAFLILGVIVEFMPLFWLGIGTFKTSVELKSAIPTLFPKKWNVNAYIEAFSNFDIMNNVWNTVFVCGMIIILQTIVSTLAAYSLSKVRIKCSNVFYYIILATQMFSSMTLMFPTYIMMTKLGMIGHRMSWVLMATGWGYIILLYKNFFDGIPKELFEAAEIDGAGTFSKIKNLILPLSKPIFSVCILNTFMSVYNDFLMPMMILPSEDKWTLMMRIYMMDKSGDIAPNVMYVLLFVTTIPSIVFYLFAQKNIVRGVASSGIKG